LHQTRKFHPNSDVTRQPVCLVNASSARALTSATQELLHLAQQILPRPKAKWPLIVADVEHFAVKLFDYNALNRPPQGRARPKLS
jgi:hypothetical protein